MLVTLKEVLVSIGDISSYSHSTFNFISFTLFFFPPFTVNLV